MFWMGLEKGMSMKRINNVITYLPASSEPLSADVYFIEGDANCYVFDVGNKEDALQAISAMKREKVVILSHYHKDHTGNIDKVVYKELYVGDLTKETIQRGTVVTDEVIVRDGVELVIWQCPSPHTKGSLVVTVNREYTLIADLYFTRAGYDKELANAMLEALEQVDTKYFVVSHQRGENVFEKQKLIAELKEYFK